MVSEIKTKDTLLDAYTVPCHDAGLTERIILQARNTKQRVFSDNMSLKETLTVLFGRLIPYPAALVTACVAFGIVLGVTVNISDTEDSDLQSPISYYYDTTGEF